MGKKKTLKKSENFAKWRKENPEKHRVGVAKWAKRKP